MISIENGKCLHVALYGTYRENQYFLRLFRDKFDIVGFNANIIAHAPQGISAFVAQLQNKNYFIDPQTHAFQHKIRTVQAKRDGAYVLKQSVRKLSERFGEPFVTNAGKTPLSAHSIPPKLDDEVSERVLDFQWNVMQEAIRDQDLAEFLDADSVELRPQFLIAPYFMVDARNAKEHLDLNQRLITSSCMQRTAVTGDESVGVYAEIVIMQEILERDHLLQDTIRTYADSPASGFILWIDAFSENTVSKELLVKYKELVTGLTANGKPVISLHGSFFSIMMSGKELGLLAGVGHGIEYGEYRSIVPVGGGVPLAKFYFPDFHVRVNYDPEAIDILRETGWAKRPGEYWRNVCNCDVCKDVIGSSVEEGFKAYGETKISDKNGKAYPTGKALNLSRKHYLWKKYDEYRFCAKADRTQLLSHLEKVEQLADSIHVHSLSHIARWKQALFVE